jgi:uncharacterized surface anchored protein
VDNPNDPSDPSQPTDPAQSATPDPGDNAAPTTTNPTTNTPKTGDETNNTVWYLLLGIVVIGLLGCVWYLRTTRKHNR